MTLTNQTSGQAPQVGGAGGFGSDTFSHMSGGNTAMALYFINQIMALYVEIMNLQKEVAVKEVEVQNRTAKATADAVAEADYDQAKGMFFQGGANIGSGFSDIASVVVPTIKARGANQQINTLNQQLAPMKSVEDKAINLKPTGGTVSGVGGPAASLSTEEQARLAALTNKKYGVGDSQHDDKVLSVLKNTDPAKFDEIKKDLTDKINTKTTEINTIETQLQRSTTTASQVGQMGSQAANAAGQFGQGHYTQKKAIEDATAEISRTTNNQSGSTVSSATQEVSKEYDKAIQEIQIVQKINDSQRVGY